LLLLPILVLAAHVLPASRAAGPGEEDFRVSVDVQRVVLTVTVESNDDRFVGGLTKEDFLVFDNGKPQQLIGFSGEDRPATVGLIIDNSRSMRPRRRAVLNASSEFVAGRHENDDFFVVHFNDRPEFGLPGGVSFSSDGELVRTALWRLQPDGKTALYDAVRLGLDHARQGNWEKRALLVISDGGDTASRSSFKDLLDQVRRSETLVYALGVYDSRNPDRSPGDLRKLAKASGGKAFFPESPEEITSACKQIAEEIRRQYTLVYAPNAPSGADGYHRLDVRLTSARFGRVKARAREGYFEKDAAPPEEKRRHAN
jgi:Ca-activated chloride channel family protein